MDILGATATELGRAIGDGTLDAVDVTEAHLDAIEGHELSTRIYARTTADRARAEARGAAQRAKEGARRSPIDGVPISWKDLYDTAGVATEAGSALLRGRVPRHDARVLSNAVAAGLVCLGKTHMTELAFSGLGLNPVTATPPCVNDREAVAGGSSSGAATSVAYRLAAAGIGSDTAGSVRIPAVWNDLVGFKTSHGRLPLSGVVPLCPSFDTVGPLTRSVEDAALLTAAMAADRAPDLSGASVRGARLLVLESVALDDIEEAPLSGFESALSRLDAAGAQVSRARIPAVEEAAGLAGQLFAAEGYGIWREVIETDPDAMFAAVRDRFRGGAAVSAPDYIAAWQALKRCRAEYLDATAGYDAVVLPTCPILPPKIARLETESEYFSKVNLMTLRNTRLGSLLGLTGLTLPTGTPSTGLLFQTPAGTESRLLRLGHAAESALA
ncbi:aspartyl-tRNA(Asn)/glutamyl-tRNA(Gln) amidotransferase subunit A [Tranquillimonas rosea]|uniref:Aspartyl-tRNA(Asn)/glutamyl-tRNA(Gln) amidotransferase subunit A n=1 Tax=Tranquillimonas rosea TaxID=641238 RepID=A0A1H9W6U0_9RHOB|nr:amidase family protein [Tranquillimonas rosea]SES29499.1 aspartyl-tRNA(Asn)/glutamyl-tRNA(Gln) amidotransferase subunit A [Tranquillimonas rosea]